MKITKEVKAAVMVLSAIALLIFGYNFLKGNNLLSNSKTLYAFYDNVGGLSTASTVNINGLQVGKVLKIDFLNDNSGKLKVTFSLDADLGVGKGSLAQIYSDGFLGGKSINIILEKNPSTFIENGDTLKSEVGSGITEMVTSKLDPIQTKLVAVLEQSEKMLSSVNKILNEENTQTISNSVSDLGASINSLKRTSNSIEKLLANNQVQFNATITNFSKASENAKVMSDQLAEIEIDKTVQELNKAVTTFGSIAKKLETNEGTAGKILNDPVLYDNLKNASRQLDMLLQDMKLNPKRYVHFSVFGKKDKPYEQPKDSLK